jgi:HEPN domain-containing protein
MSKLNVKKLIEYWLEASEKDLHSAQQIAKKTKEYVNVLFLVHLSIEKILKAYYVYKFKDHAPYTHNLIQLASKLELKFNDLDQLSEINEYNLRCRYPDHSFKIYKKATLAKVTASIQFAEGIRAWILIKLN